MAITLTNTELDTLTSMRAQAVGGQVGYWQIYKWLADTLEAKGVGSTDQTLLWLRGATEVNAERGAMSALIRAYTETQYQLRNGAPLDSSQMNVATNAIAQSLLKDLLGENEPSWPRGQVPDITRIADVDARAVGRVLFNIDLADSAAELQQNSAWSGSLLFSLLRSDQTGRLTSTGSAGTLDTLNDLRDVLYAFSAYAKGLVAARNDYLVNVLAAAGGDVGASIQVGVDTQVLGATITGYLNGDGSATSLRQTISSGAAGVVGTAFARIGEVGINRFLDMVLGAVQGKSLIGTTTDTNFVANANAFFGALTPAELQSLQVKLLPTDSSSLASLAHTDVNARAALAALSMVSVQVSNAVAAEFSLYNEATGQGNITDRWIDDRSALLDYFIKQANGNYTTETLRTGVYGGKAYWYEYIDAQGVKQRINVVDQGVLGSTGDDQRIRVSFGGEANDFVVGGKLGDRLYGGGGLDQINAGDGDDYLEGGAEFDSLYGEKGNDTLIGGSGQDWLEGGLGNDLLQGGTGIDTYVIATGDGLDTIRDADGQGSVRLGGVTLTGGQQLYSGYYQSADKTITYSVTGDIASAAGATLIASGAAGDVRIEGFHDGNLGITLGAGVPNPAAPPQTSSHDYLRGIPGEGADGLDGNDVLINGGSGVDDLAFGGAGDERIITGACNNIVVSDGDLGPVLDTQVEHGHAVSAMTGGNDTGLGGGRRNDVGCDGRPRNSTVSDLRGAATNSRSSPAANDVRFASAA